MVEQRRSSQRGRPSRRPGPGRSSSRGRLAGSGAARVRRPGRAPSAAAAAATVKRFRPRLTSRSAILVLVLAVLVVSYASSLRAYLQQRHDITSLKEQIAQREASIADLQDQIDRWQDPAYVKQQARIRFGFVMPGQTSYIALDENGERIQGAAELDDPAEVGVGTAPEPWWDDVWGSVEAAGNPPRHEQPAATIDGTQGSERPGAGE